MKAEKLRNTFALFVSSALILICLTFTTVQKAYAAQTINIDGSQQGRTFEGIGALSAGASSRLLMEYPEPYRSQILDYLFKPRYGAAFQHLKVEIGGGINSTCGCEPSHAYTRAEFENPTAAYYNRGYEWWLMKEAKKRNPSIYLDCLEWGAPAWIGQGQFYSQDNADYIVSFLKGANNYHGLTINYVGIWNEMPYNTTWIKMLRRTLNNNNLTNVKIIAADQCVNIWNIVNDMNADEELKNAIYAVGEHYPKYNSTDAAKNCGRPLWSSEDGPWRGDWLGACKLAKIYNRNYISGKMTKTIIWSLVTSYYDNLPLPNSGVIKANTPWSGYYKVLPALWATAHTTQFAQPGWKYIDSGCGYLTDAGSFVTLKSPDGSGNYSIIIETMDTPYVHKFLSGQRVTFNLTGGLSTGAVHVWRSNSASQFVRLADIKPTNGSFAITLDRDSIYSLTTTTGQQKPTATAAQPSALPFPYTENFESYSVNKLPKRFSDQGGIFEVANRSDGNGKCLRQVVAQKGIEWALSKDPYPETFLGSTSWTDYEVSSDVYIEDSGFVSIFGRVDKVLQNADPPNAYWLKVDRNGNWELKAAKNTLASGTVLFSANAWHTLKLKFIGTNIIAFINDVQVGYICDTTYSSGMAGIGSGWNNARFDNFVVH